MLRLAVSRTSQRAVFWQQAEPARRQHPQEMRARKHQDTAVGGAELAYDRIGARADIHRHLATRTAVAKNVPAGPLNEDLPGGQPLIGAIVPLL